MATTIKLKNGSGAPLAGDLVQGEPAFDLTNKRLYTEDSGGSVIEVGTNPTSLTTGTFTSTGIDDNATSTAITIDSSENVGIGTASPNEKLNVSGNVRVTSGFVSFSGSISTPSEAAALYRPVDNTLAISTANTERMRISSSGHVGIGTTSPDESLVVDGGVKIRGTNKLSFTNTSDQTYITAASSNVLAFGTDSTERMRIDSSGNVGIGTTSPLRNLQIGNHSGAQQALSIQASTTGRSDIFLGDGTGSGEYAGLVRYDHASDFMAFWTDSSESMRIDSSGNVMIGATSTTKNLLVENPSTASGENVSFRLKTNGTGSDADAIFEMIASTTGECLINFGDSNDANVGNIRYDHNINAMRFITNTNETVRIDSSGNVGIGTESPETRLHIEGSAAPSIITLGRSGNNTTGNVLGALQFKNEDGSNDGPNMVANIQAVVPNANGSGGYLKFGTHDGSETGGEGSSPVDRMIIDQDGNVLVGTTVTSINTTNFGTRISSAVPGYLASYRDVDGSGVAVLFGGSVGQVYVRGDGDLENTNNNYGAISDERLKSDIVDASSQINDIMAVQVRSYTLNETGATHIGVVAQELEASGMSGLVKTDDEGMKSVKYSILYMKAIKALQEAVTRIETLEAEVAALKGE